MDIQSMVERITKEVMQAVQESPPEPSGKGSALVVVPGEAAEEGLLAPFLKEVEPILSATWLLPRSLRSRLSSSALRGGAPLLAAEETADVTGLLRSSERLVLGLLSVGSLASQALLLDGEWPVRLTACALTAGKEVLAVVSLPPLPPALRRKVDGYLQDLRSYGITVRECGSGAPAASSASKEPAGHSISGCAASREGECSACGHCASLVAEKVGAVVSAGADRVSSAPGTQPSSADVGRMIDHTLLKADATREEIIKLCEEARTYTFASVCVNPSNVKLAAECLRGSPVKVCTVIGFPLGATTSMTKSMETRDAIANGATEIDMVINVGALKAGNYDLVRKDIEAVVEAAQGALVKVIIETALLTDEEKVMACLISRDAGADFVKTSTGFGPGGATAKDVALMRQTVGQYMGVKASGGIRDYKTAQEMIQAGATRIGASASVAIVKGEASSASAGKGY